MRRTTKNLLTHSKPISFHLNRNNFCFSHSSLSTESQTTTNENLTPQEVDKINLLLPRLCESNHLHEAIRLIDTVLLTNPPLNSLSISILIDRLTTEPNMTQPMSLLNRLNHNPSSHSYIIYFTKLLITSYLKKHKFKEVMKIVGWALRPDTNCVVDEMLYGIVVKGLCRGFRTVEALMVVKRMVEGGVVVGSELRSWVYRSLLREARIKEALELNEALGFDLVSDGGGDNVNRVVALLDQIISNWTE